MDNRQCQCLPAAGSPANGNRPVTETISPEELEAIKKFAVDHAADSENPMTCG